MQVIQAIQVISGDIQKDIPKKSTKQMQTTRLLVKFIWFRSKFGNNPGPDRANKLEAAFVPLGPLWNVDKPHIFGHFCWFYWSVFSDTL